MRKYYILILFTFVSFFLTGCQSDLVTYTIDMPYFISVDVGSSGSQIDFKVPIKDVRVIYNLNGTLSASYEDSILNLNYNAEGNNIKTIPFEMVSFFGSPLVLHHNSIQIDILKKDIDTFHKSFVEGFIYKYNKENNKEIIVFDKVNNKVLFNYVEVLVQDIYTGKYELMPFAFDNPADIKNFITEILSPGLKKLEDQYKNIYLENNPEFLETLGDIYNMCSSTEEKIAAIGFWASTIKPVDINELIPDGKAYDFNYSRKVSVDYTITEREGNCINSAYYIKACLDALGIENRLVGGYIPSVDDYHVINAIKYKKNIEFTDELINRLIELNPDKPIRETMKINKPWLESDWIWIDGTQNAIDDIGVYTNFQAFEEFKEDELGW